MRKNKFSRVKTNRQKIQQFLPEEQLKTLSFQQQYSSIDIPIIRQKLTSFREEDNKKWVYQDDGFKQTISTINTISKQLQKGMNLKQRYKISKRLSCSHDLVDHNFKKSKNSKHFTESFLKQSQIPYNLKTNSKSQLNKKYFESQECQVKNAKNKINIFALKKQKMQKAKKTIMQEIKTLYSQRKDLQLEMLSQFIQYPIVDQIDSYIKQPQTFIKQTQKHKLQCKNEFKRTTKECKDYCLDNQKQDKKFSNTKFKRFQRYLKQKQSMKKQNN